MDSKIQQIINEWDIDGEEVKQIYDSAWQVGENAILKTYKEVNLMQRNIKILSMLEDIGIPVGRIILTKSQKNYAEDDEYYYIKTGENSEFKAGDYIVKENSQDRYQVGTMATLQGVYNINRGYTVFKKIEVLTSNDEYYTVKRGTDYGLSVYDHIVLDASAVTANGSVIYQ